MKISQSHCMIFGVSSIRTCYLRIRSPLLVYGESSVDWSTLLTWNY